MKLYLGSTLKVGNPNIKNLNFQTDFGQGFYTTTDFEQAKRWAKIKNNRLKDKKQNIVYINIYEYNENKNLDILEFAGATEKWLDFVYNNRTSTGLTHNYDIIKGPVADDNLYGTLFLYQTNVINKEETIKRLKTYVLSNQISFHTTNALECINFIEAIEYEVMQNE